MTQTLELGDNCRFLGEIIAVIGGCRSKVYLHMSIVDIHREMSKPKNEEVRPGDLLRFLVDRETCPVYAGRTGTARTDIVFVIQRFWQ